MEVKQSSWRVGMVLILCQQCRWFFLDGMQEETVALLLPVFFNTVPAASFLCFPPSQNFKHAFEVITKNNYLSSKRVIVLETPPFPDPLLWWRRCTWNRIAGPPPPCCAISIFFQGVSRTRSDFPEESGWVFCCCFFFAYEHHGCKGLNLSSLPESLQSRLFPASHQS